MFDSNIKVKINFDKESQDPVDLSVAIGTLQDIRYAFEKAGNYCETEIETLKAAEHLLNEIQRGEVF